METIGELLKSVVDWVLERCGHATKHCLATGTQLS